MPRLSCWFTRLALIYLSLGLALGALLLANKGIPFAAWVWAFLPAHGEFLLLGWMTQFALGIAFWILPRRNAPLPRGDERWTWGALVSLNVGIWLYVCAPLAPFFQWLPLLGRVLEAVALLSFAMGNWRRVYPLRSGRI